MDFDARKYWECRHARYGADIRAVGDTRASRQVNLLAYQECLSKIEDLILRRSPHSVLELGFGQGHYARLLRDLEVGDYVGVEWAANSPFESAGFVFLREDATKIRLGRTFDAILAIDVIYHFVDDAAYRGFLDVLDVHAQPGTWLAVTGRFVDAPLRVSHCRERGLDDVLCRGKLLESHQWRRNLQLAVIELGNAAGEPDLRTPPLSSKPSEPSQDFG